MSIGNMSNFERQKIKDAAYAASQKANDEFWAACKLLREGKISREEAENAKQQMMAATKEFQKL
jgi:hypothetical protein